MGLFRSTVHQHAFGLIPCLGIVPRLDHGKVVNILGPVFRANWIPALVEREGELLFE